MMGRDTRGRFRWGRPFVLPPERLLTWMPSRRRVRNTLNEQLTAIDSRSAARRIDRATETKM